MSDHVAKPERWFCHDTSHLVVFSDGSQCGFRRIMSMFLHRPNFLKLTHVDIILVYFLKVPLFVIKYMYAMISGSESEKTLKIGLSHYMHLPRNGSM